MPQSMEVDLTRTRSMGFLLIRELSDIAQITQLASSYRYVRR